MGEGGQESPDFSGVKAAERTSCKSHNWDLESARDITELTFKYTTINFLKGFSLPVLNAPQLCELWKSKQGEKKKKTE